MSFSAPIDAAAWTLTTPGPIKIPAGLRYAGRRLPTLRAERAGGAVVRMPAKGVLKALPDAGRTFVEVQVNPFPIRAIARALPFGLPTIYLVFDPGATLTPFAEGDAANEGDEIATAAAVSILCAGQDRVGRDAALWSRQITEAMGATAGSWAAFAAEVRAQTASGPNPPILLLDHTGTPREEGEVQITSGATTATAVLAAQDGGDLQRTVARMHASDPGAMPLTSVFGSGSTSATLRPSPPTNTDFLLAALEGSLFADDQIDATPARRHVAFTDLHGWFAQQFASTRLARLSRHNRFTPFVNGPAYYDDLFERLREAAEAARDGQGGGLHLVGGWKTFPEGELTDKAPLPMRLDRPVSLAEAAELIGAHGGQTRFLSPRFFQIQPGSPLEYAEIAFVSAVLGTLLFAADVDPVRSDPAGAIILIGLLALNLIVVSWVIEEDGRPIELNKDAVDMLGAIDGAVSLFAPFPADIADNPASPALSEFPYTTLMKTIRHVGFYHQKFAVVRAGANRFGYAGGIDINPNRLDDARHVGLGGGYHDVHAKVEGPAVRDVEISFEERWRQEDRDNLLAFEPAPPTEAGPGTDVVQVARTYFAPADLSRALSFAPGGDRTILDTLLKAIGAAKEYIYIEDQYFTPPDEYRTALLSKVSSGDIEALVIVLPSSSDQAFGEIQRSGFIDQLRAADNGEGIVRMGYPRRHYTVPDNDLRASSGRLFLTADVPAAGGANATIALGPKPRLPQPPFWVAVEGELMYVYDESTDVNPDPEHGLLFAAVRGADTRLVGAGAAATEPRTRKHDKGVAATVVDLASIYVHAKMMIVDDVFVSIGSANINRRGLCHDGEINIFSVPQPLKAVRANPVAALRRRLWAEMLDLPLELAGPLLEDPVAAARLFDRSPLLGNRFTDIDARPAHLAWNATSGDGLVLDVLKLLLVDQFLLLDHQKLFDAVVDPTSAVENA